jgi:hypothetical protein
MLVPCILDRQYIMMYVVMSSEAPVPQYLNCRTVSRSALLEGILVVCLKSWDTICLSCHNGIVHSHQLCFAESAFTYTFKDFCCLRCMLYLVVVLKLGWQDLESTEGIVQVIKGNIDL